MEEEEEEEGKRGRKRRKKTVIEITSKVPVSSAANTGVQMSTS